MEQLGCEAVSVSVVLLPSELDQSSTCEFAKYFLRPKLIVLYDFGASFLDHNTINF